MAGAVTEAAVSAELREVIDEGRMTGMQICIVAMCFFINMLDGFDVLAMAFTAHPISDEWALKPHQLGLVFSTALVGMTIGAMFIAPLADKYGRRPVVIGSLLSIGLAMLTTGFCQSLTQLIALRAVTGLGIGAMLASLTSLVSEYTPDRQRNFCISIVQAGYSIGAVVGGIIAASIIPEYGWRAVFIGGGVLTAVTSLACLYLLPESMQVLVQSRPEGTLERINSILARLKKAPLALLPEPTAETRRTPNVTSLLTPALRNMTIMIWLAFGASFATLYFLQSWVPKLLVDAGLSLDKGIYAAAALNLGGALGMLIVGRLSTWWSLKKLIAIAFVLGGLSMVSFAFMITSVSLTVLLMLTALIGMSIFGGFVNLYSIAARVYPTAVRTTGIGWAIGIGRFGAVIGPYAAGILIGMGVSASTNFLIFAVPMALAAVFTMLIRSPELN